MDLILIAEIMTVAFGIGSIYLGNKLILAKNVLKELGELITTTYKTIEDNKIEKKELELVMKELTDLIKIFKVK